MASNPERRHYILLTVTGAVFMLAGVLLIIVDGDLMAYGVTIFGLACAIVGFVKTPSRVSGAPRFSKKSVAVVFFFTLLLTCAIGIIFVLYGLSDQYDFHAYVRGMGMAAPGKVVFWGAVCAIFSAAGAVTLLVRGIRARRRNPSRDSTPTAKRHGEQQCDHDGHD